MTHPVQRAIDLATACIAGIALFVLGYFLIHDALGVALWAIVGSIVLLPLSLRTNSTRAPSPASTNGNRAQKRLSAPMYVAATVPLVVGVAWIAGPMSGLIIAAVAFSLIGGALLLVALRFSAALAITANLLAASLALTWPIWSAGLLETHDLGPWLQRTVNLSPAFALNAMVSPEDALTHRPLAYRLMNLGQDVSYALPASVWRCVVLHAGIGVVGVVGWGLLGRGWTRMDADKAEV